MKRGNQLRQNVAMTTDSRAVLVSEFLLPLHKLDSKSFFCYRHVKIFFFFVFSLAIREETSFGNVEKQRNLQSVFTVVCNFTIL